MFKLIVAQTFKFARPTVATDNPRRPLNEVMGTSDGSRLFSSYSPMFQSRTFRLALEIIINIRKETRHSQLIPDCFSWTIPFSKPPHMGNPNRRSSLALIKLEQLQKFSALDVSDTGARHIDLHK